MNYSIDEQLRILLASSKSMTANRFNLLIEHFGCAAEVFRCAGGYSSSDFPDPGIFKEIIGLKNTRNLSSLMDFLHSLNTAAFCIGSQGYPHCFNDIDEPPPLIYVQGDASILNGTGASIVGSRLCTEYGRRTAAALAGELTKGGVTVISGGARGIDTAALKSALDAGGRVIAVLGSGIDVLYPKENAELFARIRQNGAIISEFPPGTPPFAANFPRRNRLVSALCSCLVVVEAGEKSGTLTTVRWAQEQGKEIACVPGNISSPMSRGTNRLIRDGAKMITCAEDLLNIFDKKACPAPREVIILTSKEHEIIVALNEAYELSLDELTQRCNNSAGKLAALLTMMELRGIVYCGPGGTYTLNTENEYRKSEEIHEAADC